MRDKHLIAALRGQEWRRAKRCPPSQPPPHKKKKNPKMHLSFPPTLFNQKAGLWSMRVALCGPRARLAYFAFYLTLCRGRTHQWPPPSFMFSRPESGSWLPADRHSRSDLAVRAAAIIPSAAFKHIPFALQFVQPGIVASPATPHHSPFTPRPHAVNRPPSPPALPGLHPWPLLPPPG